MATVTRTTIWSDNQVLTASALNGEFNNLLNALALTNSDVSGGAAIVESKLLFSGTGHGHTGGSDGKKITVNRAFGFFIGGAANVANDLSWDPTAPEALTAVKLWVHVKTAPTGSGLTVRVYNITQNTTVASVTVSAGSTDGSTASITTAAISAGDVLRNDITAIGSTTAGADVSTILECTQP